MTLLIDENLPATIVRECCNFVHARSLGSRPTDGELWEIAKLKGLVVLTKDTDFFNRMVSEGPPPKVIWLRVGNMRRRDLEEFFKKLCNN
jgi:predicted nuclease of predicted toxin-antitoxin system